ncbi:MAG TPA: MBL fold metallo-hydrolase [Chthonomonadaceae bacterium]|nr:MBL fold metallo-hydrolase [Chthonomonadaceae bacterium]
MVFKQILNELCGCASYLIACQTGEAAIVDPGLETEPYEALLRARGLRLRTVIDTHVHADHVSGARALAAAHGAALCMHESAGVAYPFEPLRDGQELAVGRLVLRVLHTPGHRPELISLLVINPPRSPEPSMALTGDSLLVGDVGRPDFGGGDAAAQHDSMSRLLRLPDWVAVFPGHFEGPCGKGMCGRPSTTIGFERLFNPMLRLGRNEFVEQLTGEVPPRPLNMIAIEATNRGTAAMSWAMLRDSAPPDEIDAETLLRHGGDATIIDVREPEEFAFGHIEGAISVPQAELASRLESLPRDRLLATVCHAGMRSLRAAQFLTQAGFPRVASLKGGTAGWCAEGRPVSRSAAQEAERPKVVESEWAHGGGYYFEI